MNTKVAAFAHAAAALTGAEIWAFAANMTKCALQGAPCTSGKNLPFARAAAAVRYFFQGALCGAVIARTMRSLSAARGMR